MKPLLKNWREMAQRLRAGSPSGSSVGIFQLFSASGGEAYTGFDAIQQVSGRCTVYCCCKQYGSFLDYTWNTFCEIFGLNILLKSLSLPLRSEISSCRERSRFPEIPQLIPPSCSFSLEFFHRNVYCNVVGFVELTI